MVIKSIRSFCMNYKITIFRTKYINTEKTVNDLKTKKIAEFWR